MKKPAQKSIEQLISDTARAALNGWGLPESELSATQKDEAREQYQRYRLELEEAKAAACQTRVEVLSRIKEALNELNTYHQVRNQYSGLFGDLIALDIGALKIRLDCLYKQLPRFSLNEKISPRKRERPFESEELGKKIREAVKEYRSSKIRPRVGFRVSSTSSEWQFVARWLTKNQIYPPVRWLNRCSEFVDIAKKRNHTLVKAFKQLIQRAKKG